MDAQTRSRGHHKVRNIRHASTLNDKAKRWATPDGMGMPVRNRHDPDDEADEHGPSSGQKSENQTDGQESKTNLKNDTDEERQDSDEEESSSKDDQPKKPIFFQKTWFKITAAIIVVVLLIAALVYWLFARQYEDTDDAFIDTHIVHISPQVAGQITRIAVN
ncbi:MAG TPA: hypothetical protein VFE47_08750, partial [Tepidisphaeraceae bacterium]|nr:hypothetical protein [Tepidisphaeraceae bacterium]